MNDIYLFYAFFGLMVLNIFATLLYFTGYRELKNSFRRKGR
jgi:hypothetical protein